MRTNSKYILIILCVISCHLSLHAQQGIHWSRDPFCDLNDHTLNFVTKPITDPQRNIYVGGSLNANANSPNPGSLQLCN